MNTGALFSSRFIARATVVAMFAIAMLRGEVVHADYAYAWGYNFDGQLGNGTINSSVGPSAQSAPGPVIGLTSGVTSVAAGVYCSFAVENGAAYAWGSNGYGQFGGGPSTTTAVAVPGLTSGVTAVAVGDYHSLVLVNGGVYADGFDEEGETGPQGGGLVTGLTSGVTAIAAGEYYSLAVKNGAAYGFGANWHGQLGDGPPSMFPSINPTPVTGLSSGVTAICAGGSYPGINSVGGLDGTYYTHCLAIQNGGIYAWGDNVYGELGNGTTSSSFVPVTVPGLSSGVTSIAAGINFSLAVQNGNVYAWGQNTYGELGDGTYNNDLSAERIDPADLTNIIAVAATSESSYALSADGSLWVWGNNGEGQLGLGGLGSTAMYEYSTPQHLLPPTGYVFTSISGEGDGLYALATLAPVPEPAALPLLAISSLALLSRRRGRSGVWRQRCLRRR